MKLHNQKGAAISWEALGVTYQWPPYGACDVPDRLVPLLRSEGFPVDVTPVPPKEKAARAAAEQTEDVKDAELERLKKELGLAEALVKEAQAATEAAEARAAEAKAEAEASGAKAIQLAEQVATLQHDADEFQKLLVAEQMAHGKLQEQMKASVAAAQSPPKPKKE